MAWASMDVPACCRIWFLVYSTISDAMSVSRIRDSEATRFSVVTCRFATADSSRFWTAPRLPRVVETAAMAVSTASIVVRDGLMASLSRRLDPRTQRRLIRWLVIAVLVVAYLVALGSGSTLVALLLYAYGPVAQLAPAVVATLDWPRARGAGVVAGLLA